MNPMDPAAVYSPPLSSFFQQGSPNKPGRPSIGNLGLKAMVLGMLK